MADRTYRYFRGDVLYPFGYGLSFTRFEYTNVQVLPTRTDAGQVVTVSVDVTNAGAMDGDEVVQLYLSHPGVARAPIRALAGFQRVHISRGETQRVSMTLSERELSIVDPEGVRRIVPGSVDLWIGGGQPGAREGLPAPPGLEAQFVIGQEKILSDRTQ
jgi:beta-glucosidase